MRVTVVGSGFVGQTTAMRVVERGLAEVVLIDIVEGLPQGLALDMRQSAPVVGFEPHVIGTNDYEDTAGSDVVVITAGFPRQPGMSRMDLLGKNAGIVRDVVEKIAPGSPNAIVIVVTNPLDEMTFLAADVSGFPKGRVMGMAGVLDSARLRAFIAEELGASPLRVEAMTLGSHGDSMVPLPRHATVDGKIMAILCLATDIVDLERRLSNIIVGLTRDRRPVTAGDLKASGAMTLLLKDAIQPNLVQTLEGGPALVHGGPFGNIAHGCNSIVATKLGLALGDIVLTEAGFGADLGAEKFFDIKCRFGGLKPEAAIVVATVRALKMNGGVKKDQLGTPDVAALRKGLVNLEAHVRNVGKFGVPVVVALNRFTSDSDEELKAILDAAASWGARAALSEVWEKGGEGGEAVAREVLALLEEGKANFRPLYDAALPIKQKIETIAREIYGADGVDYAPAAEKNIAQCEAMGLGATPVCIAKTQYSFSDDPTRLGRPSGFRITIRDVYPSAGAGFVVALAGDIMTMPGLAKVPAAEAMRVHPDGTIEGLF